MTSSPSPASPPKAYSYLRFSTPAQAEGDSFRRQTALAERWAKDHGMVIDRSLKFEDLGVSAYRGTNAESGRLADFKEAVRAGLVLPGSVLLVEALDRLSRLAPRKALRGLEDIIEMDITVVTLNDGKAYTRETLDSDQISLLMAIVYFMRANEESATKARRIRAAWEGKRLIAREKPLTASCPAWMTLDKENGVFIVDEDKAATLRRIFAELMVGTGLESIAKRLNRDGVPPFGRGKMWHRSYINKLRDNPAVMGTFTPHLEDHTAAGMKRVPLEPLADYYPAVIDPTTFVEVRTMNQGRNPSTKTAYGLKSILAGLATCPLCGSVMTRITKGGHAKAGKPHLVCTAAKMGKGCKYRAVHLDIVEAALLSGLEVALANPPLFDQDQQEKRELLEANCAALQDHVESILEAIEVSPLPTLVKRLADLENALDATKEELRLLDEMGGVGEYGLVVSRAGGFAALMEDDDLRIVEMNALLRKLFSKVVVDYQTGYLELEWKQGGWSSIPYAMPKAVDALKTAA